MLTISQAVAERAAILAENMAEVKLLLVMEDARALRETTSELTMADIAEKTAMTPDTIRRAVEQLSVLRFAVGRVQMAVADRAVARVAPGSATRVVSVTWSPDWIAIADADKRCVQFPIRELRAYTIKAAILMRLRWSALLGTKQRADARVRKADLPMLVGNIGSTGTMSMALRAQIIPGLRQLNDLGEGFTVCAYALSRGLPPRRLGVDEDGRAGGGRGPGVLAIDVNLRALASNRISRDRFQNTKVAGRPPKMVPA